MRLVFFEFSQVGSFTGHAGELAPSYEAVIIKVALVYFSFLILESTEAMPYHFDMAAI